MEMLPITTKETIISKQDFFNLKSILIIWLTFLQSFGINLFAQESIKKIDYSLLDKLLDLPFSEPVMNELKLRVELQKKYNTDANGNIHSLDRFLKEIINFIVSQKDFQDFKLLNSIQDKQIDYTYMFHTTAKHNEVESMKYLQQKLISHKDDTMLHNALEYAIKSQSFDTTLHLMQQKIKLDEKSQTQLLTILHKEEYENFYKKISGNKTMMLPNYSKESVSKKRKMDKKTFTFEGYSNWKGYNDWKGDTNLIYEYLKVVVHNSMVDLYTEYLIDDFDLYLDNKKVYITTFANQYPITFIENLESTLYKNGFNTWGEDLIQIHNFECSDDENNDRIIQKINKLLNNELVDTYDFLNIEMM